MNNAQNTGHNYYILAGSNLGLREEQISEALSSLIGFDFKLMKASSLYSTEPWGISDQPEFLNQVWWVRSDLEPEQMLTLLKGIEHKAGPAREKHWGPRHLDLDILLCDELILDLPHLKIPHPRLEERRFALAPLAEIAPEVVHPVSGKMVLEMLVECEDELKVTKLYM